MDHSQNAAAIFNKHASYYMERFMDVSMYAKSFDFLLSSIQKENGEVLEIASGPGNITKHLLDKKPDLIFDATDLSENMISLAKQNNPSANCFLLDARDIKSLNKKYDVVIAGFAFPYLNLEEVSQFIADAASMLNEQGLLYISTMEKDYEKSGLVTGSKGDELMMYFYTEKILAEILSKHNLKINYCERVRTVMTNGDEVVDLVLICS
jgi:cyclopropane fatty-acyl-phospholipid synthase-like methyltransferase